MQGVILAAGRGTRLRPVTETRTKAMAPVAGKPIVARVIELLAENGIRDFVLVVSPDDPDIRAFFAEGAHAGVQIQFVEQRERLGMAHALRQAAPLIHDDFILSACDNLVPSAHIADLLNRFAEGTAPAVLSLLEIERERVRSSGVVELQPSEQGDRIVRIVEKPTPEEAPSTIASLPLYVFSQRLLAYLPEVQPSSRGEYELQDAIQMLIDRVGPLGGVFAPDRIQLTNADDLLALNRHYMQNEQNGLPMAAALIGPNTQLIPPLCIEDGVTIGANCVIGPNVCIERHSQIGDNVHLRNAIILKGVAVSPSQHIEERVVL